ncbi:MAG: 4Fe-4S dicluster domain-containing protein [Anaerotignum faecicola]
MLTKDEAYIPPEERNCIRCGKCVEHCPMGLDAIYA